MKALIQRVRRGRVTVGNTTAGSIGNGYVVLLGIRLGDTDKDAHLLAHRTVNLRILADAAGRMNLALADVGGSVLVVSQFTLYADTRKGNRPSFINAADPALAERLYGVYVDALRAALGPDRVATGVFRTAMVVELENDGPVTIELSTDRS